MFTVKIRDHFMIAHSLPRKAFGPAQKMHGATYVVDAEFKSNDLDENNVVINMKTASNLLTSILEPMNHQNLDELHIFKGKLTTTEYLAYFIHQEIAKTLASTFTGSLKITLKESPNAGASYEERI
jgi:6-pyruvoyltetrahydropterin/6-carboxytetrahydropterin synthase